MELHKTQVVRQESLMEFMKSEYMQHALSQKHVEHDLAAQKQRNLEIQASAQRVIEQQQSEIAQLAKSTVLQKQENESAQLRHK